MVQLKNPIVVLLSLYFVNNCEKIKFAVFCYLFTYSYCFFIISLININPRRPVLGTERAGPMRAGGEGVNTPRVTRLLGHVATRGKLHSEENQK